MWPEVDMDSFLKFKTFSLDFDKSIHLCDNMYINISYSVFLLLRLLIDVGKANTVMLIR